MLNISEEPSDPMSQFSLCIFRLNSLLMQNGDHITRPLGMSSARWQILGRAAVMPQTVPQLARDIGQSRQSVQRIADILVKERLAVYKPHPSDKRTRLLELTSDGEATLAAIYERYNAWLQQIVSHFDMSELIKVTHRLKAIEQDLQERIGPAAQQK